MEKKPLIQNEIDYYHEEAIRMIVKEEKLPSQVKRGLIQLGADEGVAAEITNSALDLVQQAKKKKATNVFAFVFVAVADPLPWAQNIWPLCKISSILSPMILDIPALTFPPRLLVLPHLL